MDDFEQIIQQIIGKHTGHLTSTGYFQESERKAIVEGLKAIDTEVYGYLRMLPLEEQTKERENLIFEMKQNEQFRLYKPKVKKNKRYKGMKGN